MSVLVSFAGSYTVTDALVLGSARGCPGSTCISHVWLEMCNTEICLEAPIDISETPAGDLLLLLPSFFLHPPPPSALSSLWALDWLEQM